MAELEAYVELLEATAKKIIEKIHDKKKARGSRNEAINPDSSGVKTPELCLSGEEGIVYRYSDTTSGPRRPVTTPEVSGTTPGNPDSSGFGFGCRLY